MGTEEAAVGYWVREPFPSVATGTSLRAGGLAGSALAVTLRMNEGGVVSADWIEQDSLAFDWGRRVELGPADRPLTLVVA